MEYVEIGFLFGKLKLVFIYGYIVFWLEFCVVVFVSEIVIIVIDNLDYKVDYI